MTAQSRRSPHNVKDYTGQRSGYMEAIRPAGGSERKCRLWIFKCHACGQDKIAKASYVFGQRRKSCGCLGPHNVRDYTGQRSGDMEAIRPVEGSLRKVRLWLFTCHACGRDTIAAAAQVFAQQQKSCGCRLNCKQQVKRPPTKPVRKLPYTKPVHPLAQLVGIICND